MKKLILIAVMMMLAAHTASAALVLCKVRNVDLIAKSEADCAQAGGEVMHPKQA